MPAVPRRQLRRLRCGKAADAGDGRTGASDHEPIMRWASSISGSHRMSVSASWPPSTSTSRPSMTSMIVTEQLSRLPDHEPVVADRAPIDGIDRDEVAEHDRVAGARSATDAARLRRGTTCTARRARSTCPPSRPQPRHPLAHLNALGRRDLGDRGWTIGAGRPTRPPAARRLPAPPQRAGHDGERTGRAPADRRHASPGAGRCRRAPGQRSSSQPADARPWRTRIRGAVTRRASPLAARPPARRRAR